MVRLSGLNGSKENISAPEGFAGRFDVQLLNTETGTVLKNHCIELYPKKVP